MFGNPWLSKVKFVCLMLKFLSHFLIDVEWLSCFYCNICYVIAELSVDSFFRVSKFLSAIWCLLLSRNSLVSVIYPDWRINGVKTPSGLMESIFSDSQMMHLHPHYLFSMVEVLGKTLAMRVHHLWRPPGEIYLLEGNGRISFLQLMSCEYHLLIFVWNKL